MKRIVCILLIGVLLGIGLCACGDKGEEPAADGVMTAVKNDSGDVIGYERRYHNDSGDITRLDSYDADQNYLSFVLYGYDDNGRLFTETAYGADGIAQSRTVYSYDDDGKLAEKALEMPHGDATVERYNTDGIVVEKLYYNTDEQLSYREVLEDGKWVRYDPTEPPETQENNE